MSLNLSFFTSSFIQFVINIIMIVIMKLGVYLIIIVIVTHQLTFALWVLVTLKPNCKGFYSKAPAVCYVIYL